METVKEGRVKISVSVKDVMKLSTYFQKYEPESSITVFFKDILHGFIVGNVILLVYYEGEEFKGGVVLSLISEHILFINFSYLNQDVKNLSKKFMLFILELCKKLGIKKLQTKATQHLIAAEKKFGFKTAYTVIEKIIDEEIKKEEPPTDKKVEFKKGG